ncbi:MAG: hypothetical protein GY788_07885 [bacterium]|nr:hypothetical protein [bacterium]
MLRHTISGVAREAETGLGVAGLYIKAYDKDLLFDDLLGSAVTDQDGRFVIITEASDFRDFVEAAPDIYLKVYSSDASTLLFTTKDAIRWNTRKEETFDLRIPREALGEHAPRREIRLLDDAGQIRDDVEPGESLVIEVVGVEPDRVYDLVLTSKGETLFTNRLLADHGGTIEATDIWPQMGLSDIETGEPTTVEAAEATWAGRELTLELQVDGTTLMESQTRFPTEFRRPVLLSSDPRGIVRNGIEVGQHPAVVSGQRVPHRGRARVYMVPRQAAWVERDPIEPVELTGGRTAIADVEVGEEGAFSVEIAAADELQIGAYDFIVRYLRYGYEDDDDLYLRVTDLATRDFTGLVVREEFMLSKFAKGGCVNVLDIAGRSISGRPYFRYANSFEVGEPIYGALDPLALDPALVGKMVALYVIEDKTAAQWSNTSLQHLSQLGGNSAVQQLKVQSGCINANKRLLWSNSTAGDIGKYEVVADFGNLTSTASSFVPNNNLDQQDIVDGYTIAGFQIVPDPGTATNPNILHFGVYNYTSANFPSGIGPGMAQRSVPDLRHEYDANGALTSTINSTRTLPFQADVRFPADAAGATQPSQISTAFASYPIIVLAHGQGHHYQNYDYLLEHWARNGFIAVSIDLTFQNTFGVARAHMIFEHLTHIKSVFGSRAADNIGLIGHSRGGEGVVTAARLNDQLSKGHSINAVISLAPTNQFTREQLGGSWATPYMVIYGSMDFDVSGVGSWHPWLSSTFTLGNSGFALWDRASGEDKTMVFVHGATHNGFLDGTGWDIEEKWGTSTADWNRTIGHGAHKAIASSYMTAFFRRYLRNETEWQGLFRREWIPASVAAADGGNVKLYLQYQDDDRVAIDTFEDTHTASSWQASTISGTVSDGGTLVGNPVENELYLVDNNSPHETGGLVLEWNNSTDHLRFTIPSAHKDLVAAGWSVISLRIGQKVGGSNPANAAQDLYLTLEDGDTPTAHSRSIRVGKFFEIPTPHVRDSANLIKSAMVTVRIPLHVFEIKVASVDPVSLDNLVAVQLDFGLMSTGEVAIDSVAFSK